MRVAVVLVIAACGHTTAPPPPLSNHASQRAAGEPFLSLWRTGHRIGDAALPCAASDYDTAIRAATSAATPLARASAWSRSLASCSITWETAGTVDPVAVRAARDFAISLLDAGFSHDCVSLLAPITTPYNGGIASLQMPDTEALGDEVQALAARCIEAEAKELSVFAATPCPGAGCLALVWPRQQVGDEIVCPVVEETTAAGTRRLAGTDGPLADVELCCTLDEIGTITRDGRRYVHVGAADPYNRVCGGGTASETPSGIYRIDDGTLTLVVDRSIIWH